MCHCCQSRRRDIDAGSLPASPRSPALDASRWLRQNLGAVTPSAASPSVLSSAASDGPNSPGSSVAGSDVGLPVRLLEEGSVRCSPALERPHPLPQTHRHPSGTIWCVGCGLHRTSGGAGDSDALWPHLGAARCCSSRASHRKRRCVISLEATCSLCTL